MSLVTANNDERTHSVSGQVKLESGVPAAKLKVRLYGYKLGVAGAQMLRELETDEAGAYKASFTAPDGPVRIELRAVISERELTIADLACCGPGRKELSATVFASLRGDQSEFERLLEAVGKLASPAEFKNAVDNDERRDLSILAQATGWDARLLALASMALEDAEACGAPAEGLYGLYRTGLPAAPAALAKISAKSVDAALRSAVDASLIGASAISSTVEAFIRLSSEERLKERLPGTPSSLRDFVEAAPIGETERRIFLGIVSAESNGDLWQRARAAGLSSRAVSALKLQGALASLTLNQASLSARIQPLVVQGDPRSLIDEGFDKPERWKREFKAIVDLEHKPIAQLVPSLIRGISTEDRVDRYARELSRRVREMDPHRVTVQRLKRSELAGIDQELQPSVAALLQNAMARGFALGRSGFGRMVADARDDLFRGVPEVARTRALKELKTLHRLYSITPSDEAMDALLRAGLTSARDVAAIPIEDFARWFGKQMGSEDVARRIHWKAQQVAAAAFHVLASSRCLETITPARVTDASLERRGIVREEAKGRLQRQFPTLEKLFGSVDYSQCDPSRSVLSPAAYYVDILQFINPPEKAWSLQKAMWSARHGRTYDDDYQHPYYALLGRRPDLPHLALSRGNADTELPYIDLANEVLELQVANGTPGTEAIDTAEDAVSEDLVVEPQHLHQQAYEKLACAVYPRPLPFDLPLETARALLDHLQIPLWRVREVFADPNKLEGEGTTPGLVDVWFERLGLNPDEVAALTGKTPWFCLYGFATEPDALEGPVQPPNGRDAAASLRNARTLARRLGLTYRELVELLKTNFVNPFLCKRSVLDKLGLEPDLVKAYLDETLSDKTALLAKAEAIKEHYPTFDLDQLKAVWSSDIRRQILVLYGSGSDFSLTELRFLEGPAAEPKQMVHALWKMTILLRLQRRLGWPLQELDRVVCALVPPGVAALDNDTLGPAMRTTLMYLAHLTELLEFAGARTTREEMTTLWSPISISADGSLYARLFLRPSMLIEDAIFDDPCGAYLEESKEPLLGHLPSIRQALQMSAEEVEQVLSLYGARAQSPTLTIDYLSLLLRHRVLARVLDVTQGQLSVLLRLSRYQPLCAQPADQSASFPSSCSLAPAPVTKPEEDFPFMQTLPFVRQASLPREAGLDVDWLDGQCRHQGPSARDLALDARAEQLFLGLVGTLRKEGVANPDEEADRRLRLQVVQAVSARLSVPEGLIAALLTDPSLLAVPGTADALIESLLAARVRGFACDASKRSARVRFPAGGSYVFTLGELRQSPAHLVLGDREPLELGTDGQPVAQVSAVEGGSLYSLALQDAGEADLLVEGSGLSRSPIEALDPIPEGEYLRFAKAAKLLIKAVELVKALGFGESALRYLARTAGAASSLKLGDLPIEPQDDGKPVFEGLMAWIELAILPKRLGLSIDEVISSLAATRRMERGDVRPNVRLRYLEALLQGGEAPWVAAGALGLVPPRPAKALPCLNESCTLAPPSGLLRLADAVAKSGLKLTDLARWAQPGLTATVADEIRATVKASYSPRSALRIGERRPPRRSSAAAVGGAPHQEWPPPARLAACGPAWRSRTQAGRSWAR